MLENTILLISKYVRDISVYLCLFLPFSLVR